MAENTSPEEKLFKIIQQEKKTSPGDKAPARVKNGPGLVEKLKQAFFAWKEKLVSGFRGIIKKKKLIPVLKIYEIKLFTVNAVLSVLLLLIILFAVYYAISKYPSVAKLVSSTARARSFLPSSRKDVEKLNPLNYYTEDAKRRDIFNSVQTTVTAGVDTNTAPAVKSPGGELKLEGIAWSDVPKALILSDKDNKLYVVKEGQMIGTTSTRVKSILHNKVILNSGDKDFEL